MPGSLAARLRRGPQPEPLPKPLSRVRWLLGHLGYTPAEVALVVEHCRRSGTALGCELLAAADLGPVEDLLSRPDV